MGFLSAMSGFLDTATNYGLSNKNLQFQQQNLQWQRYAQNKTWAREDDAVGRRVDDLQRAGLSPVLAAGSAAQAGQPMQTQAPQRDFKMESQQKMMNTITAMKMKRDIHRTEAETDNINAQTDAIRGKMPGEIKGINLKNELQELTNPLHVQKLGTETKTAELNRQLRSYDINKASLDIIYKTLTNTYQSKNITKIALENSGKEIAIRIAQLEEQLKKHNINILKETGLSSIGLSEKIQIGLVAKKLLQDEIMRKKFDMATNEGEIMMRSPRTNQEAVSH